MQRVLRLVGWGAWAILVLGTGMYVTGSQSTSLAFYDFFQENYVLLPFLVGVLMGIGIGLLFARSLLTAGIAATVFSICTIGGIALAFQAAGRSAPGESRAWAEWGTLGIAVAAIGALLL